MTNPTQEDAATRAEIARLRKLIDAYESQCLKLEAMQEALVKITELNSPEAGWMIVQAKQIARAALETRHDG